jgi:hypothetical protein
MNVKTGNAQNKQILSALPPLATGEWTFRIGSFVPMADIAALVKSISAARPSTSDFGTSTLGANSWPPATFTDLGPVVTYAHRSARRISRSHAP